MLPSRAAISSARTVENHMPSTPKSLGSRSTAPSSKTMVLKKEISADTQHAIETISSFLSLLARYFKEGIDEDKE